MGCLGVKLDPGGIVVGCEQGRWVVLRPIHHAGLQGAVGVVVAHGDAVTAHGVHGVDKQGVAHHTDLETFEVGRRLDFLLGVEAA